jgi:hypothetical protein
MFVAEFVGDDQLVQDPVFYSSLSDRVLLLH